MGFWFFRDKRNETDPDTFSKKVKNSFINVKNDMQKILEWISFLKINYEKSENRLSEIEKNLENMKIRILNLEEDKNRAAVWTADQTAVQTAVQNWTAVRPKQTAVQKEVGDLEKYFNGLTWREGELLSILLNTEREMDYNDLCEMVGRDQSTLRGQVNKIKIKYPGAIEETVTNKGKKSFSMNQELKEKISERLNKKKGRKGLKVRV